MGVANVAYDERDGRHGVGYRESGVFPRCGWTFAQSEFQSRSHDFNSTKRCFFVTRPEMLNMQRYTTDTIQLYSPVRLGNNYAKKVRVVTERLLSTGRGVTVGGASDRGTTPAALCRVRRTSSDNSASRSDLSGKRRGYSTIEYYASHERSETQKIRELVPGRSISRNQSLA